MFDSEEVVNKARELPNIKTPRLRTRIRHKLLLKIGLRFASAQLTLNGAMRFSRFRVSMTRICKTSSLKSLSLIEGQFFKIR